MQVLSRLLAQHGKETWTGNSWTYAVSTNLMGWPIGFTSLEPLPAETFAQWLDAVTNGTWWPNEPDIPRVAKGITNRVDRLKALGNGQVSAVVAAAWKLLTKD